MKHLTSIIFGIFTAVILTVAASAVQVTASIPNFNITLNGVRVDNQSRQYPLIVYNEITYFPMTYFDCRFLGLTSEWNSTTHTLNIKKENVSGTYNNQPYTNTISGYFPVDVCDFPITVNGRYIDNSSEQYPLLNYRDVTYFPLTWHFAHDEFGWNYSYTQAGGLIINSSNDGSVSASAPELYAEQIYNLCSPAVFYIELYDRYGNATSSGSGFFIDSYGTAVTNYHVIEDAYSAKIQLAGSGVVYNVLGVYDYDEKNDWAIIKVGCSGNSYLEFGDASTVTGGSVIYTIGSPEGLQNTISQGIISNPARVEGGTTYIQITAPISHGSSGGALINKYGKVIGITSAGYAEGQNLNFAIPITAIYGHSTSTITPLSSFNTPTYTPPTYTPSYPTTPSYTPSYPTTPSYTPSYSVPYYSGFYGVPDFGKIAGATLRTDIAISGAHGYYYYPYFDADNLEVYVEVLLDCGFYYLGSFEDDYGYTQLAFKNSSLGYSVVMGVSSISNSYMVMITW